MTNLMGNGKPAAHRRMVGIHHDDIPQRATVEDSADFGGKSLRKRVGCSAAPSARSDRRARAVSGRGAGAARVAGRINSHHADVFAEEGQSEETTRGCVLLRHHTVSYVLLTVHP
jgi:hypothetical protein